MKKLFLRDGKLFVGEFPEEPIPYGVGDEQYFGARMDEYYAACSAAREKAVEVVNYKLAKAAIIEHINDSENRVAANLFVMGSFVEGHLYALPKGWDVEYFCDHFKTMEPKFCSRCMGKCPDWIARLVPLAEKGAGDDYPVIDHPHHKAPVIATYQRVRGIVATGIPEADSPTHLMEMSKPDNSQAEKIVPFESFLPKPMELKTGSFYSERVVLEAANKFAKQFARKTVEP